MDYGIHLDKDSVRTKARCGRGWRANGAANPAKNRRAVALAHFPVGKWMWNPRLWCPSVHIPLDNWTQGSSWANGSWNSWDSDFYEKDLPLVAVLKTGILY